MEKIKMEINNNERLRERKGEILKFLDKRFTYIIYILLLIILIINFNIRTLPLDINPATNKPGLWDIARNDYTLGPDLDPFVFTRGAQEIIRDGRLPEIDMMRYYPLGYVTAGETKLLPYIIAYTHKLFVFLGVGNGEVIYAAIWMPVLFSLITTVAFFLLVRKIFEERGKYFSNVTAIIASLFFITVPTLLPRTIAGIPEKESVGFGLMFLALYFFLSAWKVKEGKHEEKYGGKHGEILLSSYFILSIAAGLFTALMGLIWGGVIFVYVVVAISGFITFLMERINKKELIIYGTWLFSSAIFWIPFTNRMTIPKFFNSSSTGIAVVIFILMIIHFLLFKYDWILSRRIKNIKSLKRVPKGLLTLIVTFVFSLILFTVAIGPLGLFRMGGDVIMKLTNPYVSRIAFTVAENRQPFFTDWRAHMGPTVLSFPLFFWLFFIGSVILFSEVIKNYKPGEKSILITAYIAFLVCLIFSRSAPNDILNGETGISKLMYVVGFLILIGAIIYIGYKRWKIKESMDIEANFSYIFVFSLVFIAIIAGRSGVRLLMVLITIAIIPASYIIVTGVKSTFEKKKDDIIKLVVIIFAIMVVVSGIMIIYYQYQNSKLIAKNEIPNAYTWQWQKAMKWVRDNTPTNSAFYSWWDYGYWIQSIGERATMTDGGNSIPYWNYLTGRHVLTTNNEQEALDLAYTHNISYLLIDSSDIGKYGAYSNIGSDEKYDRFSWISTFQLDESQTRETNNQTIFVYNGGTPLDEDLIITENGEELYLPAQQTIVAAMIVPFTTEENGNATFQQPYAIMVYNGQQYRVNLRYLFFRNNFVDYSTGIESCAYIFPKLVDNQGYNPQGSAFFLSPRNMRALLVKLYLLNQGDNFKLVHVESNEIVRSLRSQGLNSEELIYYKGIQGPIKIWEIEFTGNETFHEDWMLRDFPQEIEGRKNR